MQLNHIMSNILIIKHGSLGDLIQANGAIKDIRENFPNDKIILLTTPLYIDLMSHCPYIDGTLIDRRLPRWNLFYLLKLKNMLDRFSFIKVFDLQNSSRTKFYKNILFKNSNLDKWSSSETTLPNDVSKEEFDKNPVLDRFDHQLKISGLETNHTMKPDFSWSCVNIDKIKAEYNLEKYILIFPFCSPHLAHKKWPYYNELIYLINNKYNNKIKIVVAPGPMEINDAKEINATCILNNENALDISQLSSLIKDSSYIIANDTGPAHMAAHLNSKGITLFGHHTSAKKVSIERENFKPIQVEDLNKLSANKVFEKIIQNINVPY